ncbi:MAG: leucine--tRNA ligase [Endomicrobium sp.]|jgi:leucyl-tRNA synthetase|nr:leucine--tRNA ligase [Endomicrobium sp.]
MKKYNYFDIEKKWQNKWKKEKVFESNELLDKKKYYCLVMLPYPSGDLHMGHVRNYTIGDVVARFYRMQQKNVLHPMGWDAFGLPAENAAINNKIHPVKWIKQNIFRMKKQLQNLGFSYDWSREIKTCDPKYYKWNQWFFIKMWDRGLVFKKNAYVNWCKSCKTVLANEQISDNTCWRCNTNISRKKLNQWFLKITDYADELLNGHKQLSGWPKQVISMQKKWINKTYGMEISFTLSKINKKIKIFTTRPDTLFGVTFLVISPEHDFIDEIKSYIENYSEVEMYIHSNRNNILNKDKTGIKLNGISAINPLTNENIPIYTSDYVSVEHGTGIIMAVPAHDQRDWEFAKKFNIPIKEVIKSETNFVDISKCAYEDVGILINSWQFNGIKSDEAVNIISRWVEKKGVGKKVVKFKLKDWLVSRQRYWGTPIPMIHCKKCGIVAVSEKKLPVLLPEKINFVDGYGSLLQQNQNFINVKCPKCGIDAKRETDTMDTFIDSSWYYLRYCDINDNIVFDINKVNYWMPVDQYIGGIEHACMHLLYSRFWYKVIRDLGLVKHDEPFTNLLTQGMVTLNGTAMSKSKKNIISPDEMLKKYGADTTRLFILFAAPPKKQFNWTYCGLMGCWRFINRIWQLLDIVNNRSKKYVSTNNDDIIKKEKIKLLIAMHKTIKKVTEDIKKELQLNTAISCIMKLVNILYSYRYHSNDDGMSLKVYESVILLMAPFTPHVCEEIWEKLGHKKYISTYTWPTFDENIINESFVELPIQINGKLRGKITVSKNAKECDIKSVVGMDNKISIQLQNKKILKFIYIKNKIISIIAK